MRYVIAIVGLVLFLGAIAGLKASQISTLIAAGEEMQKAGPPPEVVSTSTAKQESWEATINAVGSVVSEKGVALSNDSPGIVSRLHFDSGAMVKQGQILLELDSSVERAQLASTRARRELAEVSVGRSRALAGSGVLPKAQLDSDESSFKSTTADASALQAQIERKIVRAPFSGRLGIRAVNLGQYLAPGTTITVLESTESVFVDFTLPQQELGRIKNGMLVRVRDSGTASSVDGRITAIDPAVDAMTRSVKVRVSVPNADDRLLPGMFVNVAVVLPDTRRVVSIPATAVVHASYGDSVFIVEDKKADPAAGAAAPPGAKPGKVARQQFVKLGEQRGDFVAVAEGLKIGEEVVTSGAFKLRNMASVAVDNKSVQLKPELAPTPENR